MATNTPLVEQFGQSVVTLPQVLNPNRCIDQRHYAAGGRRRGIGRIFFSVPPSAAKRRALSSAMRASKPRRTKAVFSVMPVSLAAFSSRSSSMFNVVRICIILHRLCIRSQWGHPSSETAWRSTVGLVAERQMHRLPGRLVPYASCAQKAKRDKRRSARSGARASRASRHSLARRAMFSVRPTSPAGIL